MPPRSATVSRISRTVAFWSVQNHANHPCSSSTRTTRTNPPTGGYVPRNVLYFFIVCLPYRSNASVCQPPRAPARLARLIRSVPYFRGRPRPFLAMGLGTENSAASLRKRPTTTAPLAKARRRKGRFVNPPSTTTQIGSFSQPRQRTAHSTSSAASSSFVWNFQPYRADNSQTSLARTLQFGQQRQTDGAPQRVTHDPRERHPHMSVDKRLIGRSWRGIVVDSRPFHMRAVALGHRVVERQPYSAVGGHLLPHEIQQTPGNCLHFPTEARQEIIEILVVVAQAPRTQPVGHRATAHGKQRPNQHRAQAPSVALVQQAGHSIDPRRHRPWKLPRSHPWFLHPWCSRLESPAVKNYHLHYAMGGQGF